MSLMHKRWAQLTKGDGQYPLGLTEAERALEVAVCRLGAPYRVQHPLFLWKGQELPYFPDFLLLGVRAEKGVAVVGAECLKAIIEVDDGGHKRRDRRAADAVRTEVLHRAGYLVGRCTNAEALSDPFAAVNRIMAELGLSNRAKRPE